MRSLRTTTKSIPRSLQPEKARMQQRRPNTAKNKLKKQNKTKQNKKETFFYMALKENKSVAKTHSLARKFDTPTFILTEEFLCSC